MNDETNISRGDAGDGIDHRMRGILALALLSIVVGGTVDLVMDQPRR